MKPKHQAFVTEYLKDKNATQAAIRAGYSAKNADVTGPRLLGNVGIRQAIDAALNRSLEKAGVTREWITERLVENVSRAMQAEAVRDHEGKPTGEYTYQGTVANRALELLGKDLGMFVDRSEVEFKDLTPQQREARVLDLLRTAKQRKATA